MPFASSQLAHTRLGERLILSIAETGERCREFRCRGEPIFGTGRNGFATDLFQPRIDIAANLIGPSRGFVHQLEQRLLHAAGADGAARDQFVKNDA